MFFPKILLIFYAISVTSLYGMQRLSITENLTALKSALQDKNTTQALALIQKLTPITVLTKDKQGFTALLYAITYNNTQVIEALLAKGALPYTGKQSQTINDFLLAIILKDKGKLQKLRRQYNPVNIIGDGKYNALHIASALGHKKIVAMLLQTQACIIDAKTSQKTTALDLAQMNGHAAVIHLIHNRAHSAELLHYNALITALKWHDIPTAYQLIDQGAPVNATFATSTTPLLLALPMDTALAFALIEKGADVNAQDVNGETPLMVAAELGDLEMVNALISQGAHLDTTNNRTETALTIALYERHRAVAKLLLTNNAKGDIVVHNSTTYTALIMSIECEDTELIQMLLHAGAIKHINTCDNFGWTPLMFAAQYGNVDIITLLIQSGANVNITDQNNLTALFIALDNQQIEVAKLLITHHAQADKQSKETGKTVLLLAIAHDDATLVRMVLDAGGIKHLHTPNNKGITPLTCAIETKNNVILLELIERGVECSSYIQEIINQLTTTSVYLTKTLNTILQHAPTSKHYTIIKTVLRHTQGTHLPCVSWALGKLATFKKQETLEDVFVTDKALTYDQNIKQLLGDDSDYTAKKAAAAHTNMSLFLEFYQKTELKKYIANPFEYIRALGNLYVRYTYNQTVCMWASIFGHSDIIHEIIKHLLPACAITSLTSSQKDLYTTHVQEALAAKEISKALHLINAQDVRGRTALMYAIIHENFDIAYALLTYAFSSINLKDKTGKSALTYALEKRDTALIDSILRYQAKISNKLTQQHSATPTPTVEDLQTAAQEGLYVQATRILCHLTQRAIL